MSRRPGKASANVIEQQIGVDAGIDDALAPGASDADLPGLIASGSAPSAHPGAPRAPSADPSAPRPHRFAAVGASLPTGAALATDLAPFAAALEAALTLVAGLSFRITPSAAPAPGEAEGSIPIHFTAPGGGWLSVTLSTTLAEALVNQRCGGSFSGDGRLGGTASVVRQQAELVTAMLRAAAVSWLADGAEWTLAAAPAAKPTSAPPPQYLTVVAGEVSCPLTIGVAVPASIAATEAPPAWANDLRRLIGHVTFPVRAVLFETRLPLAKAAQLRPGDVLPIETPRDVGLRVGTHRLASGTIAPAGDGGHLVTIRASARSFLPPSSEKAPL